jgi:hypothetical protein
VQILSIYMPMPSTQAGFKAVYLASLHLNNAL